MAFDLPTFSIIIPTYARPKALTTCLTAIVNLDYPCADFEVIVVDDGSDSPPTELVASYRDRLAITLVVQGHAGPAQARNTGAERARGQFLAFTDDDCVPHPNWLRAMAEQLRQTPSCGVGGQVRNALSENLYSTTSQALVAYLYQYYLNKTVGRFFTSNNFATSADQFKTLGGFDKHFHLAAAEDRDFCDRWQAEGYDLVYISRAVVYHSHYLTPAEFWQQHYDYGRGAFHFHRLRAKRQREAIRLEPFSFYTNLMLHPFRQQLGWRKGALISLLTVLSQAANVAGYWSERWRERNN